MGTLILVRHGQSEWNLANRFTGWTDVELTEAGATDALTVGKYLKDMKIDIAFVSRLKRAQHTLENMMKTAGQNPPVEHDSALNERHYGDLQGLNKADMIAKYGEEQVKIWRRSYNTPPPGGESMADCERRTMPFFKQYIMPHIDAGKTVLVSAHGNSLRPIMKFLDGLTEDQAASLETEFCVPYIYYIDGGKAVEKKVVDVPDLLVKGGTSRIAVK